ncbi:MAG: hypothetical protein MJ179_04925 [Treponema sp.]|nr:hypothetical protein [Treponema sp.]
MKNRVMKILILVFIFVLTSCSNILAQYLLRDYSDPKDGVIQVDCFSKVHCINVTWEEDECADLYRLMRADNSLTGNYNFTEVYSGTQTEFCDKQLDNRKSYVYRLDKERGRMPFRGTKYAYAVCSDVIKDSYEDNDTKDKATFLDLDCSCNIFYAPFYDGIINDEDWFCVKIPPRRTAEIVVNIKNDSSANLQFNLDTQKPEQIHNGIAFTITNEFFEERIIPFCISINPENIRSFVEIDYEIALQNIIPKK